jgi:hypothetical protein
MSREEVAHRIKGTLRGIGDRVYVNRNMGNQVINDLGMFLFDKNRILVDAQLIEVADKICNDIFDIFSLGNFYIGNEVNYHTDYKSKKVSDDKKYSMDIDYRDEEKIGDIKYIWELNRHLFILQLAIAYKGTGNDKYLKKIHYFLASWFVQNPFLKGVNWSSTLEVAIRVINWSLSWQFIASDIGIEIRNYWIDCVYKHLWYINRNLSSYSSANNHLIGEAAGLFIGSILFPQFDESNEWISKSKKILEEECEKQNYNDGVNKEQAFSYQQFVLDFLIISGIVGKRVGCEFSDLYWLKIEKMIEFIYSVRDFGGNYPKFGDEDDGFVIDLCQRKYGVYDSLLNLGAVLFKKTKFLRKSFNKDLKTRLLLHMVGVDENQIINDLKNKEQVNSNIHKACENSDLNITTKFEDGGYYILGCNIGKILEEKMIFDCGALGYLSIAAHGHADSLAFTFSAGGCPIFIDPGTYVYHTNKKWRNYFRSTRAHNTINVDGMDQSIIEGNFMWSNKANSKIMNYNNLTSIRGIHDGYMELAEPVVHMREVIFDKQSRIWTLKDEIKSEGLHNIEFNLHLSHECSVIEIKDNIIKIKFQKGICLFKYDKTFMLNRYFSDAENMAGWYSPSYDVLQPTTTLRFTRMLNGKYIFINNFKIDFKAYNMKTTGIKIMK